MTDYRPIDCALYSEYELAIIQGRRLRLSWHDETGQTCIGTFTPLDLLTRDQAEYLVAEGGDGQRLELRLDRISHREFR